MASIALVESQDRRPTRTKKPSARTLGRDLPQLSQNPLPTHVTAAKESKVRQRVVAGTLQLEKRDLR